MFKKFPMCLYRVPGPYVLDGVQYDGRVVQDEDELQAALADGWHPSIADATKPEEKPVEPTREELEAEATRLGVKFDGRTTDAKLAQRIAEAK